MCNVNFEKKRFLSKTAGLNSHLFKCLKNYLRRSSN